MQASQEVTVSIPPNPPQGILPPVNTVGEEEPHTGLHGKDTNLSLQIPSRTLYFSNILGGEASVQSQISSRVDTSSSSGGFLRGLSFKKKGTPTDAERSHLLNSDPQGVSSPLLNNVMSKFGWKRCVSLPVPPAPQSPSPVPAPVSAQTAGEQAKTHKEAVQNKVSRSLSVPVRNIVIVRSLSFAPSKKQDALDQSDDQITPVSPGREDDEEISEEEAVCRICLDACEEGNTFKMECSCKGALRLIHEECATKWFGTRTNKNCDVCGREIMNLPVTLLRVPSSPRRDANVGQNQHAANPSTLSAWQDFSVLVIISTVCYFFFLEQLLVQDLKTDAIVLAAPFAFTLGLTASILAVMLAIREYIWAYAALEFALVAVILCLFYYVLHLVPLYAILLSAVLGFGIAMSLNSLYVQIFAWRVQNTQNLAAHV